MPGSPAKRKKMYQEYKRRFAERPLFEHVRAQLEFILHKDQEIPDELLRRIMEADGWYPLDELMEHRSIKKLHPTRDVLIEAAEGLECVEVDPLERDRIRLAGDQVELRHQVRVYLDHNDRKDMIEELRFHPEAAKKIGEGVAEIFIAKFTSGNLCFFVEREDGSFEDFTLKFKGTNRYVADNVRKAFRVAVLPDIHRFKETKLSTSPPFRPSQPDDLITKCLDRRERGATLRSMPVASPCQPR